MSEEIYSPGLEGVIAGETAVSTIEGGLSYRGFSIEDLADHASFDETAYLILHGEPPTREQLASFQQRLATAAVLPAPVVEFLGRIPLDAPMMDVMRTGASLIAHWDPETADNSHDANVRKAERILAQMPTILAARDRQRNNLPVIPPDPKRSFSANLLWMLRGEAPSERAVKAIDVSLILYAEHEFNASTFTSRVVVSTLADIHSAITAAIGALKGPLHGGANERVMEILQEVGSADQAEKWVRDALARKQKIMGFGHRVYKTGDPRARYLKPLCQELAQETGHHDIEQMADIIEQIVTGEKKLPPNLDWPSARLYYYLGLPIDLYTPLFVVSRVTGWSAHAIEQLDNNRLIRPRSRYVGVPIRKWPSLNERS